jgi:Protein of unknown function (DUF2752)
VAENSGELPLKPEISSYHYSVKITSHLEWIGWTAALVAPVFIDPFATEHFTICVFHWLGFDWCPGCGLGRSIALLYRGEFRQSLSTHFMGLPAVLLIAHRIYTLLILHLKPKTI